MSPEAKTILVVDGYLPTLTAIKCILEGIDYNVLIAHSGASALRVAERHDLVIDLMLIDAHMPDITRPELAERIQAIRPRQKVIFMSKGLGPLPAQIAHPESDSLRKPFTVDTLLQTVQSALGPMASPWGSTDSHGGSGGGTPLPTYTPPRLEDCPTRSRRTPLNPDLKR
jgi:CheY-like chemotaxis protein